MTAIELWSGTIEEADSSPLLHCPRCDSDFDSLDEYEQHLYQTYAEGGDPDGPCVYRPFPLY